MKRGQRRLERRLLELERVELRTGSGTGACQRLNPALGLRPASSGASIGDGPPELPESIGSSRPSCEEETGGSVRARDGGEGQRRRAESRVGRSLPGLRPTTTMSSPSTDLGFLSLFPGGGSDSEGEFESEAPRQLSTKELRIQRAIDEGKRTYGRGQAETPAGVSSCRLGSLLLELRAYLTHSRCSSSVVRERRHHQGQDA
jgi:hypothetical protein